MIIRYYEDRIQERLQKPSDGVVMPKEFKAFEDSVIWAQAYNYLSRFHGSPLPIREGTTDQSINVDDFIKKIVPLTDDLLRTKTKDQLYNSYVSTVTGEVIVHYRGKSVIYDKGLKRFTFIPNLEPRDIQLFIPVTNSVADLMFEEAVQMIKAEEEVLKKKWAEKANKKYKKGDVVTIMDWSDIVELLPVHDAPVEALQYVESKGYKIYKGQIEYTKGKEAVIKTAHKDGKVTLTFPDDVYNNRVMISGAEVVVAEPLVYTTDVIL